MTAREPPPPVRPEHPLRTQSHSVPASPEPRPGAGGDRWPGGGAVGSGGRRWRNARQHTVLQRHHFEPLASFEKPTPRHSTTCASDTIAKEDKQRGTVGSGRGLWAVELRKRCERAGKQVPAMNVETKALIRHRQDRDGHPRTRHSPGRPKGSGESISGVVVPSLVHLDSCRASSGPWGLVVATPSCQWPRRPESRQHQDMPCDEGVSNSRLLRQNDLTPWTSRDIDVESPRRPWRGSFS